MKKRNEDLYDDEGESSEEEQEENADEFEVEKIIERRWNSRMQVFEYYLKWKDWSDEWNTWEPEESLVKSFSYG